MDIIMSMCRPWGDMILNKEKPFEFRNFYPRSFNHGDKIFIYESKNGNGRGKVIGYFTTNDYIDFDTSFLESQFILYFLKNIKPNKELYSDFEEALKINVPGYKKNSWILYATDKEAIKCMRDTGKWVDATRVNHEAKIAGEIAISECGNWLTKIGLFDDSGETRYKRALVIDKVVKFDNPVPLSIFTGDSNARAPQSWMYFKGGV